MTDSIAAQDAPQGVCVVPPKQTRTEVVIMGMRDNACRERILDAIRRVDGVSEVSVSLIRAKATIDYTEPCAPAALVWAIVSAGFGAVLAAPLLPDGDGNTDTRSDGHGR